VKKAGDKSWKELSKEGGMPYKSSYPHSSEKHGEHRDIYRYSEGQKLKEKTHVSEDWFKWNKPKPPVPKKDGGK
jgi:hypothetical protein